MMESEMAIYVNETDYHDDEDDDDDKDDYLDPEEDYIIPDGSTADVDPRPSLPSTPILGFQNGRSRPVQGNNLPMFPPREGKKTPTPTRAQKETPKVARKETPARTPRETPTRTPRETPTRTRKETPSPKETPKGSEQGIDIPYATIKSIETIDAEELYGEEQYMTVLPNCHAEETDIYDDVSMGREDFEKSALPSPAMQNHNERGNKELELLDLRSIHSKLRDSIDTLPRNVESQGCCCCYNCVSCFIKITFVLALLAFLAAGTALVLMFAFPEFITAKQAKCPCTSEISLLNAKIASLNDSINYLFIQLNKTTNQSLNVTALPP